MNMFRALIYLTAGAVLILDTKAQQGTTTTPPWFPGYDIENPTNTEIISCATTETFLTYGDFARCCDTTAVATGSCLPATGCSQDTLFFPGGSTSDCGTSYSCATMTVFQTSTADGPSVVNVICAVNWSAFTIFQELAATTTSSSSSGTTTSSAAPTTSPRISSSIPSATSITTPTPSQSPTPGHSSSKAWIAGAVIGPIAAIALAFLGYWLGHRRAKATAEQAPTYTDSKPPGEWPPRHELGSDGRQSIPPGMHEA